VTRLFAVESIEVVRQGRFTWQVHTHIPDGLDTEVNQPFWFRWRAERHARRAARREWGERRDADVVLRLTPDDS
jgi:hypothetical protein